MITKSITLKLFILICAIFSLSSCSERYLTTSKKYKKNVSRLNERLSFNEVYSRNAKEDLELIAKSKKKYRHIDIDPYIANQIMGILTSAYNLNKKESCGCVSIKEMEKRLDIFLNKSLTAIKKEKPKGADLDFLEKMKKWVCPLYPFCS